MNCANYQYPEVYRKDHSHYTYYTDDHKKIVLIAGENDVTEEWIMLLKQMHREEINMLRRGRSKGAGKNILYNLDSLTELLHDKTDLLIDPSLNTEDNYIKHETRSEYRQALAQALAVLSFKQRYIFVTIRLHRKSVKAVASEFGISRQSLTERLFRIEKKLRKILKNIPCISDFQTHRCKDTKKAA